jgi:hypothetical protein
MLRERFTMVSELRVQILFTAMKKQISPLKQVHMSIESFWKKVIMKDRNTRQSAWKYMMMQMVNK